MRLLTFAILCFFSFSFLFANSSVTLSEALKKGYITLEASGTGGHTERSLEIKLTNLHKKKWELVIPAGFLFHSKDTSDQDLLVVRDRTLEMEKGRNRTVQLHALCTQANNASPGLGSAFLAGQLVSGHLLALAQHLDQKRLSGSEAQDAVWAITNDHPLTHIGDPDLAVFLAELLGKELPAYIIDHHGRTRPGQIAFRSEPVLVRGLFEYQTEADCQATFGLYNEEGERIITGFEDKLQRAGGHRFQFHFEIRNLPAGTYYARMTSEDKVLGEMKIEF